MKKACFVVMLLVVCVGLPMFAAGGKEVAQAQGEKLERITFMVDGTWLGPDNGEEIIEHGYEALTGIDLVLNHPVHNEYYPKLDLAFTTGDIPDVFVAGSLQYLRYAAAGALYDMTELYETSKMKNNMVTQDFVDACRIDGKLYGLPAARGNGTLTYIRMDWLEKLGMREPSNYAEFLDMLRAFRNRNPDGLAPDKVIAITAAGLANAEHPMDIYLREFYQDATPDYILDNGTWVDGMLQPNMRAALTRMREAYAEGLIDREIITNQTSSCRDKFFSGIVGAFNYWAGYWNDRIQMSTEANIPHAKVRGIPAIRETFYVERPPGVMAMSAKVANPKAIFDNWFELLNDVGPGQTLFTFGVEGKTYEEVDGVKRFLPQIVNPSQPYDKSFVDPSLVITRFAPEFVRLPLIEPSFAIFNEDRVQYGFPSASEELGKLQKEINEIKKNTIAKVVYGDYTVEEGLQRYAESIRRYNDVVLPDMNK